MLDIASMSIPYYTSENALLSELKGDYFRLPYLLHHSNPNILQQGAHSSLHTHDYEGLHLQWKSTCVCLRAHVGMRDRAACNTTIVQQCSPPPHPPTFLSLYPYISFAIFAGAIQLVQIKEASAFAGILTVVCNDRTWTLVVRASFTVAFSASFTVLSPSLPLSPSPSPQELSHLFSPSQPLVLPLWSDSGSTLFLAPV